MDPRFVIRTSFLRLCLAGGLCLLGLLLLGSGGWVALSAAMLIVGGVWVAIELLVLGGLLLVYGLTGLAHDIGANSDRDPWHRW